MKTYFAKYLPVEGEIKEGLPKYFIVKRDSLNPLWDKYINWLNKTYRVRWSGRGYAYYGFDRSAGDNGTDAFDSIHRFKNNPTLLTLEEWDSIVNPKEEFILPEKWCIAITPENQEVLNNWRINIKKYSTSPCKYSYITEDGCENSGIIGK